MGAEDMQGPPQRTATPPPVGEPSGGVDQPAIQHADPPGMATHGSGAASAAAGPGTEPEDPMPDTGLEAGLHPPAAHGAQPAVRAGTATLANPVHHTDASAPEPWNPREVRDPEYHNRRAPTRSQTGNIAQRTQPRRRLLRCLPGVLHG